MKIFFSCVIALAAVSLVAAQTPVPRPSPIQGAPSGLLLETSAPVTGAPFSAVELVRSQQTYAPGNLMIQQRQSAIFRDSAGRVRVEHLNASLGSGTLITIVDPVAGYVYELNPATVRGIRTPIDLAPIPSRPPAEPHATSTGGNAPQVETTDLGSRQMSGVTVTGTRTTTTFNDDGQSVQSVREQWVGSASHVADDAVGVERGADHH